MDSFAQAAAYLQPSLEFVAKLSSIIPVWMMMVMADKHFLGLPLLEGSVWYSPRIPPRFTISSGRGEQASGSKSGRHSASSGPSSLEHGFPGSTIPYPRPFQALHGASTTTALTIHQHLEAHDLFVSSSDWLEHGYVGSAVLLVGVISFLTIITTGCGYLFGKSKTAQARNTSNNETPFPKLSAHEQLTEEIEFPTCWESILEDILSNHSNETLEDSLDQSSTPMRANEDEYFSPPDVIADNAEKIRNDMDLNDEKAGKVKALIEENEKGDQTETVTETEKEKENPEEEIPEMHNEENGQGEKTEANKVDDATTGGEPESFAEAGNENGSEAGKGAGKEYSEEGSKVDNKEDGPSEPGNNEANEDLEISAMGEGIKKKKRRVRQNAKKRAAKLAAAKEAGKEVRDASNALLEGPTQGEDKDGKSEKVKPGVVKPEASDALASAKGQKQDEVAVKEVRGFSNASLEDPKQQEDKNGKSEKVKPGVMKPEASDALASAKSQKQDEVVGKEVGDSSNAFLEGPKQRKSKGGKSKGIEPEVVEPGASDALATAKGPGKETEATAKDTTTTGKGGGYSFKEADLHDATFVAADTAKKTSLPPRPPTPQPIEKPVPVGLPSKPQFTGLPTPKSSGTPQPSPAAAANSSPGSDLLASLITRPKGSVPPLMPHHQSFGAAQSSSNKPSGQFSTPFPNIPGLNVPTTAPSPNHIQFKVGAVSPSPDGQKPLFANLPAQGEPTTGTDPRPKNAYSFGNGYPSAPIFGNLPPGSLDNDAFKLPTFGPSAGFGQSSAGPAKTAPMNQSFFQNIPPSSKPFTGFGSPSAGPAKPAPTNQSIFQNVSVSSAPFTGFDSPSAGSAKKALANQSVFQNMPPSSKPFTGFGSSSAGPAKTTSTDQSIFQNASISSGQFKGFGSPSADPAKPTSPAQTSQSIFQNVSVSSRPFIGFGSSNASPAKTTSTNQPILQNTAITSGQFTGFESPSAGTTNPPLPQPGSMFQKIAQPPMPLSLNQQRGVMPLQNAVTGAMNSTAGDKMEGKKPTAGPGASPFKPRLMPKGRLGLSKPEKPWPCARQRDGASFWQTGEFVSWPHARQMNGKPFWR